MKGDPQRFVQDTTGQARPIERAWLLAEWEAAVSGTAAAVRRLQEAQLAWLRFWADPRLYRRAETLRRSGEIGDPLLARQVELIYLAAAQNQQEEAAAARLAGLEAEVRRIYYTFRGRLDGRSASDNELDAILRASRDGRQVQRAWEAGKQVGALAADTVRELARLRNRAARAQGFRDHFQRSLTLNEIDEAELLRLFETLDRRSLEPFRRYKEEADRLLGERFGIDPADLRPWHYGDRFFQEPVPVGPEEDLEPLFAGRDPVGLAVRTYDGLGLEVRGILSRSDLYARPGKNQHAFCTHIDREGDIRTLNNLEPNRRWSETLHHELGHAVYEQHLDPGLPWLLRAPSHTLTTEAVAILMGSLTNDEEWLSRVLALPAGRAASAAAAARRALRAQRLVFTRWCLVMTGFERALYRDPEADLDTIWWDLVERYQLLRRPEGRRNPDWAAKIHIALTPVYYQNYALGHLAAEQLRDSLRREAGGLADRREAGLWLAEKVFRPGARESWSRHLRSATGRPLDPQRFEL